MIELSGISVRLSGKTIVEDVSFAAKAGELTAIAGPNGSGKTTTMKAISGELSCDGWKKRATSRTQSTAAPMCFSLPRRGDASPPKQSAPSSTGSATDRWKRCWLA